MAEFLAAEFMREMGFSDVRVTQQSADGGYDVISREAIAEVKWRESATPPKDVRALNGVKGGKQALFFSLGGYSKNARRFAHEQGVALFIFSADAKSLIPVDHHAAQLWGPVADARRAKEARQQRAAEAREAKRRERAQTKLQATERKAAKKLERAERWRSWLERLQQRRVEAMHALGDRRQSRAARRKVQSDRSTNPYAHLPPPPPPPRKVVPPPPPPPPSSGATQNSEPGPGGRVSTKPRSDSSGRY